MSAFASTASSPHAYRASAVLTASHGQLIVMLYDGARRFLRQARVAMSERQIALAHTRLSRAEDILRHLRATLDMDQGQLPERLLAIYTFSLNELRLARIEQDPTRIDRVSELLGRLRDAWAAVAGEA
ncbi:MAG TPA: flagellar export chaperone FliS [Solirubrobacteraceae bacterium]|nr:flagellar export chaperone FliS [Solirubrobacteraceae bacterium]